MGFDSGEPILFEFRLDLWKVVPLRPGYGELKLRRTIQVQVGSVIREKLREYAKQKHTSVNILLITILGEFFETYRRDKAVRESFLKRVCARRNM